MVKGGSGSSNAADARTAGKEAAGKAKSGLSDVKIAFAYASVAYDLEKLLEGIGEELPGVPVLG
ncbi:MAG: hypothetical protein LBQ57_02360, partial [Spirochaetales bacterium]|nr:hypothetical protein [Spirochaetales bacterium]